MRSPASLLLVASLATVACVGPVPKSRTAADSDRHQGSPLGASYVLLPLPGEDESLLGRVLMEAPEPGRSLEETARPNPCADKLAEPKTSPLSASFEDAEELSAAAKARAMLGAYGFEGDAEHASHFMYKLEVAKRVARTDTTEYVACCKEKGCGYGYVSALIYGDGEYATGQETRAEGKADFVFASGAGEARLEVIHRRRVKGWLAAVITVTDPSQSEKLGPLGVAKAAGISEATVPEQVKALYEAHKVKVATRGDSYVFVDGRDKTLTENDFVRRFRETTGSKELDDVNKRHNTPAVALWGGLAAVTGGVMVYGLMNLKVKHDCTADWTNTTGHPECSVPEGTPGAIQDPFGDWFSPTNKYSETNGLGVTLTGLGGLGFVASMIFFLPKLLNPDGPPTAHFLTERDANLYAERYNRSLLRKTVKDVERNQRHEASAYRRSTTATAQPKTLLGLVPGGLGLSGSF